MLPENFLQLSSILSLLQEGDRTFWEQFESEVSEFKSKTAGMEESKVLGLIRDPTRPLSNSNPLSDDEDL